MSDRSAGNGSEGASGEPRAALRGDVTVEKTDRGLARITIPRPDTLPRRFLSFIFRLPSYKILTLDETGTEVLSLINGRRTFSELAAHLARAHSLEDGQARRSMAAFLDRLARERVIEFRPAPGGKAG